MKIKKRNSGRRETESTMKLSKLEWLQTSETLELERYTVELEVRSN